MSSQLNRKVYNHPKHTPKNLELTFNNMHDKYFITVNKYVIMSNMYACLLVSSLLFLVHPFTTDKLLTPTNLYIRYQCSTRYSINIIMTILGHHPRPSHTPCLLGLIPRAGPTPYTHIGVSSSRALGTFTQGPTVPHKQYIKG